MSYHYAPFTNSPLLGICSIAFLLFDILFDGQAEPLFERLVDSGIKRLNERGTTARYHRCSNTSLLELALNIIRSMKSSGIHNQEGLFLAPDSIVVKSVEFWYQLLVNKASK